MGLYARIYGQQSPTIKAFIALTEYTGEDAKTLKTRLREEKTDGVAQEILQKISPNDAIGALKKYLLSRVKEIENIRNELTDAEVNTNNNGEPTVSDISEILPFTSGIEKANWKTIRQIEVAASQLLDYAFKMNADLKRASCNGAKVPPAKKVKLSDDLAEDDIRNSQAAPANNNSIGNEPPFLLFKEVKNLSDTNSANLRFENDQQSGDLIVEGVEWVKDLVGQVRRDLAWHLTEARANHWTSDKAIILTDKSKPMRTRLALRRSSPRTRIHWIVRTEEIDARAKGFEQINTHASGWHLRFLRNDQREEMYQLPKETDHLIVAQTKNLDINKIRLNRNETAISFSGWAKVPLDNEKMPHSLFVERGKFGLSQGGGDYYLMVLPRNSDDKILGVFLTHILSFQAVHQRGKQTRLGNIEKISE